MNELTDKEQQLLAYALFTTAMRVGPDTFETMLSIAKKTNVFHRYIVVAEDWVSFGNTVKSADIEGKDIIQK